MKGHVAAAATAIATLGREGFRPASRLRGDSGRGSESTSACPGSARQSNAVRTDYCVNEGAASVALDGRPVYLCTTAEKLARPST